MKKKFITNSDWNTIKIAIKLMVQKHHLEADLTILLIFILFSFIISLLIIYSISGIDFPLKK